MSAVEPAADSSHVHCQQRVGDMVRNDDSDNDAWFDEAKANNNSNHTDLEHYYYEAVPPYGPPPVPAAATVVKAEEVGIVAIVLVLWVAAIALFINRWGKIRQMEPYQPYFEPEPPPAADASGNGSHRASIFDHPSFSVHPGTPGRRPSNLSGFMPPPSLGLGVDRRLSVFIPQRRASYFAMPTRRASFLEPDPYLTPHTGLPRPLSATSRRTSVCTAAEYFLRSASRRPSLLANRDLTSPASSKRSSPHDEDEAAEATAESCSLLSGVNLHSIAVPKVRCILASPDSASLGLSLESQPLGDNIRILRKSQKSPPVEAEIEAEMMPAAAQTEFAIETECQSQGLQWPPNQSTFSGRRQEDQVEVEAVEATNGGKTCSIIQSQV